MLFRKLKLLIYVLLIGYAVICVLLYVFQSKVIFLPTTLKYNHEYAFTFPYKEYSIVADDGVKINSILAKSDESKGVVFYLHGNAGNLDSWGWVAPLYTQAGYDFFILDYRGFGKSEGQVESMDQLFSDNQEAYNF